MIWAGSPFAQRIEFSTGLPTGAISFQLLGNDGSTLLDDTMTPPTGALSCLIVIDGALNTCTKPLFEGRTLVYSYTTANGLVDARIPYRVQKPVPFPVSAEGVRLKLGLDEHEMRDDEIDLVSAYSEFVSLFDTGALVVYETTGDRTTILCIHAIEAIAALQLIPSLQLKVAQRETGGTNEYQRFGDVDWRMLEAGLAVHIDRARAAIDTTFDGEGAGAFMFGTVTRTDAITGAV